MSLVRGHVWTDGKLDLTNQAVDLPIIVSSLYKRKHDSGWDDMQRFARTTSVLVEAFRIQLPNIRWYILFKISSLGTF